MEVAEKKTDFIKVTMAVVYGVIGVLIMIFILAIVLAIFSPLILTQIPGLQTIIGDTVNLTEWFENGGYFYLLVGLVIVLVIISFLVGLIFYAIKSLKKMG